jgi:type I restriction enzyme S subunit
MKKKFPLVSLEAVLRLSIDAVPIDAYKSYPIAGVYSFGRGLLARTPLLGTETTYKVFHRLRKDDFVLSQLKAWEGALARVPETFDGWFLSPQFPTFRAVTERLDIAYLDWYFKQSKVWEQLKDKAQGMGARRDSVSIKKFLSIEIPLPPLEEQRRIVARVEELVGKVEEVRSLRQQAVQESNQIYKNVARQIFDNYIDSSIAIEKLVGRANLKNGKSIRATDQESGIKCIRLSAIRDGQIDCTDSKAVPMSYEEAQPYLVKPEDVFIVRGNGSKHLVGQAGIVKKFAEGTIFPDLFIQVPLNSHKILPSFFVAWWNNPLMREKITEVAKTTSGIWKINQGHIASFSIPVPPIPEQYRIVAYLDELQSKLDAMKRLREQAIKELDALLPSILDKAFKGEL